MGRRRLYPQEKTNTCAVACLRTVLALQFDVRVSERALELLGTDAHDPIEAGGTDDGALIRMVANASFALNDTDEPWALTLDRRGTLAKLARARAAGLFPLVTVCEPGNDTGGLHMVVVLDMAPGRVRVFDPQRARATWRTTGGFENWWTQENGYTEYAVVA